MPEDTASIADVKDAPAAPATEPADTAPPVTEKPATEAAKPAVADKTMAEGAVAPAEAAKAEAKWREDWREALASGDEKALSRLKRFAAPENVFKSWAEMDRKMSAGAIKAALPDNPSPEDIAAYRKSWGVPDTVEGYEIKAPEGVQFEDGDKAALGTFLADMHRDNVPKGVVQKAADSYFKIRQAEEQQMYEAAVEVTTNQRAEIRAEYGRDFERNTKLADSDLVKTIGQEAAKELTGLTLANGTKLGDNPAFLRYAVNKALAVADDAMLVTSELGSAGTTLDDAYKTAIDLKFTDPTKYHSDAHQKRLTQLAAAMTGKSRAA